MFEKIIIFIFGSCVGSFLNVCIYRLPQGKSIVKPRSFCPKCNISLKWYDNIPVLSYFILRGKCRSCSAKISLRYPFVEFITGLLFLVLYLNFSFSLVFAKFIFLFCLLVVISFIDIDYYAIPGYICVIGIIGGLVFSFLESGGLIAIFMNLSKIIGPLGIRIFGWDSFSPFLNSVIGLLFGLGFVYLFKLFADILIGFYLKLSKKESIEGEKESLGLGDVDFMGMVGAFLGIKAVIFIFFLAPFFGFAYVIYAFIFKKSHLIPYLPYLSLATIVVSLWGDKILNFIF